MHPDSVSKMAFITPDGHYEFLRVPFGLANAPAVFHRVIDKMLGGMQNESVLAYIWTTYWFPQHQYNQGLLSWKESFS